MDEIYDLVKKNLTLEEMFEFFRGKEDHKLFFEEEMAFETKLAGLCGVMMGEFQSAYEQLQETKKQLEETEKSKEEWVQRCLDLAEKK